MSQVYKLFLFHRYTEAWHALSDIEQKQLSEKVDQALEQVGGKRLVLCDTGWSSETILGFGVEVFPDVDAVQKHSTLLQELNWLRYVDTMSVIGTEFEGN